MKIIFADEIPDHNNINYAIYNYDEVLANKSNYIDIRAIVRDNSWEWLDEIQDSHVNLSKEFLSFSKWWWITEASRLNVQAWGQGPLIKPLLFAKAVMKWKNDHQDCSELHLVDCNVLVRKYITEFDDNVVINKKILSKDIYRSTIVLKRFVKETIFFTINFIKLLVQHTYKKTQFSNHKTFILHEAINNSSSQGRAYFYGSIFDEHLDYNQNITIACTSIRHNDSNKNNIYLLDQLKLSELIKSAFIVIYLFLVHVILYLKCVPCLVGKDISKILWREFLINQLNFSSWIINICCYWSLKRGFLNTGTKNLVIHYEEKGLERAIIKACNEFGVEVVGYMCHPMHRSLLALKDTHYPSPKPDRYGVAGSAFLNYYSQWGNKNLKNLKVWGSGKEFIKLNKIKLLDRTNLNILVLLSHPDELRVLKSWFHSEKRLTDNVTYYFRYYKAANPKLFNDILMPLVNQFKSIIVTNGTLTEDLKLCDISIFCTTSAGIVAIKHGFLSIHVDLNDFFEINPCFDDLKPMLTCKTSLELSNQLDNICNQELSSLTKLYKIQEKTAENIFGSVQEKYINDELKVNS